MIARGSILMGKIPAAEFAAAKAEALAAPDSTEINRAKLYDGAAEVFTPAYESGEGTLDSLNTGRLSREESTLKDAALSVSQQIHAWPQIEANTPAASLADQSVPQQLQSVMASTTATIEAAQKALAESDGSGAPQP